MWPNEGQGGFSTQWALNPSAYQNMANDEVDWAQLAQQWIKMKETYPPEQVPPAPPPPPMKPDNADIEGGEAPMEMDTKDDDGTIITAPPPPNVSHDAASWNSWNNWQQWGWNWQQPGAVTGGGAPAAAATGLTAPAAPHISSFPPADALGAAHVPPAPSFSYNHAAPAATPEQFNQHGYWVGDTSTPYIRQKAGWRGEKSLRGIRTLGAKSDEEEEQAPVIDAAKRKTLPAWIREGLEKMEKEKQKKQEQERLLKERQLEIERRREMEEQALREGKIPRSKFESDTEESEKEDGSEEAERDVEPQAPRRSRFDQRSSTARPPPPPTHAAVPPPVHVEPPPVPLTKEQIMQETMLKVRKILTEILMSVTSQEIRTVVNEEYANMRAKGTLLIRHSIDTQLCSMAFEISLYLY